MPTQTNKEAKLNSEINSQLEPGSGRARRSAALHSKQAWQSLVPHHKKDDEETDEDMERLQFVERSGKRKSVVTLKDNGSKKRLRETRVDDPDFEGDEISTPIDEEESETNALNNTNGETKQNNLQQKQKQSTENEKNLVYQSATSHQRVSILGKRLPILAPKTTSFSPGVTANQSNTALARFPPQQLLLKSGAGALNKEELEEIEREMEKHQFQNDDSYKDDYDELEQKIKLDHSNDEDYEDLPSRSSKRLGAIKSKTLYKKREVGQTSAPVGRPRGPSKNLKKTSKPAEETIESSASKTNIPPKIRKGEFEKKPVIMKPSGMPFYSNVYQPNQMARSAISGQFPADNRTLKVLRIRTGAPNSICQPSLTNISNQSRQIIPSVSYTSMINGLSKEINDLSEKYSNCVVPGTTVQEFNNIIDQIIQELKRVTEEKALIVAENREYVENINAQLELKDRKIFQLENTIETLQSKLMVAFKRIQMNALKHDTTISAAHADDSKNNVHSLSASSSQKMAFEDNAHNDKNENNKKIFNEKDANGQNSSTSQSGGTTMVENVATSSENAGNITTRSSLSLQKVLQSPRILNEDNHHYGTHRETIPKMQLKRRTETKNYENEEDENDLDKEEHYEKGSSSIIKYSNIKSSANGNRKPVMLSASAAGGGSIFSSTRVMMPTSLNTLQGKFVPNNSRSFCNESEEGYEDEEEIMDEEMAIADEELVHGGEVGANQTVL